MINSLENRFLVVVVEYRFCDFDVFHLRRRKSFVIKDLLYANTTASLMPRPCGTLTT